MGGSWIMKDYIVIIPLYSKVIVKGASSPEEALDFAKNKAIAANKKCQFDYSSDPEIIESSEGEFCHLISEP